MRRRLLWLIDSLTVGGAESLVLPFARRLDRRRYELTIACMTTIEGNAAERQLRDEGFDVVNLDSHNLRDVGAFRRLLSLARSHRFDLVHAHLTYASIWAAVLARLTRVPCVASLHVAPPRGGRALVKDRLMRLALDRWAARVIAVSAALRDQYLAAGGIDPAKFVVVHNGIDVDRFVPATDASRSRTAITVSVLREGKGIDVLLAAARHVPDTEFVIVGDGAMRAPWTSQAATLGIADRVTWTGHRTDVAQLLPGHGVFVLPTLDDAFPTVLLEAMAAGLPVIASRVGGIPEIVDDGITGVLVPPGDPNALARAIAGTLARDTTTMRAAARRRAERQFSIDAWIARLEQVYDEVALQ